MPSPAAGFLTSPHATQSLTTAWAVMKLTVVATDFPNAKAFGGQTFLGDVELDLESVAAGATAVQAMLTYDVAGHYCLAGPTAATTFGILSGALGVVSLSVDQQKVWPTATGVLPGECYLWLKTNAGTASVSASGARLQWRDMQGA